MKRLPKDVRKTFKSLNLWCKMYQNVSKCLLYLDPFSGAALQEDHDAPSPVPQLPQPLPDLSERPLEWSFHLFSFDFIRVSSVCKVWSSRGNTRNTWHGAKDICSGAPEGPMGPKVRSSRTPRPECAACLWEKAEKSCRQLARRGRVAEWMMSPGAWRLALWKSNCQDPVGNASRLCRHAYLVLVGMPYKWETETDPEDWPSEHAEAGRRRSEWKPSGSGRSFRRRAQVRFHMKSWWNPDEITFCSFKML